MKIEEVELFDFRSHTNSKVEFGDGINVILGRNGAGKTTILEAISVALYGSKAAKVRKEDLIRDGAARYRVSLKFRMNDKTFRIVRTSDGECYLRGDATLDGDLRVTDWVQRLIPQHVFQNAIYVRQGEIESIIVNDESREKLIRKVTRIDDYEAAYKQLGSIIEQFRRESAQYKQLASQHDEVKRRLEEKRAELESSMEKLEELRKLRETLREELEELRARRSELEEVKERLSELKSELERLEFERSSKMRDVERLNGELEKLRRELEDFRIKARKAEELEKVAKRYEKLEGLLNEGREIEEDARRISVLEERRRNIMRQLEEAERLRKEAERLSGKIAELEGRIAELSELEVKLRDVEGKLSRLEDLKRVIENFGGAEKVEELVRKLEVARGRVKELQKEKERVKAEIAAVLTRWNELKKAVEELRKVEGKCPTCGRELTREQRDSILRDYAQEMKGLKAKAAELKSRKEEVETALKEVEEFLGREAEIVSLASKLGEVKTLESELSKLDIEELRRAARELERLRREKILLEGRRSEILVRASVEDARAELESVEREIERIEKRLGAFEEKLAGFGFEDVGKLRNEVEKLKESYVKWLELKGAREHVERLEKEVERVERLREESELELRRIEEKIGELRVKISGLAFDESEYVRVVEETERKSEILNRTEERIRALEEKIESLRGDLEYLEKQLENVRTFARKAEVIDRRVIPELQKIREKFRRYRNLVAETAMREVERIASRIFEELTDGKYGGVRLKRVTERGKEKLKLSVLYRGEERDVSFLSGGELISLAIAFRLALTIFLVRGKIPLLILDEPTPFLDEERRRKLVEIIDGYLRRIPQVIIVTHDDELKEAADRIIRVDFSGGASRVSHVEA